MDECETLLKLKNAIVEGFSEDATDLVKQALDARINPKYILDEAIISGAEEVQNKKMGNLSPPFKLMICF